MRKKYVTEKRNTPRVVNPACAGYFKDGVCGERCLKMSGAFNCFNCRHFETKEQYRERCEKANARLRSLPLAEQEMIAEKYHEGIKEWWNKEETK